MPRNLAVIALAVAAVGASAPAVAEVTLTNAVGSPITVQYGYADANGFVEWTPFLLEPCFTATFAEAPNLRLIYPAFIDGRPNPDTGTIAYQVILLNQPATLALFLADPVIMVNVFGTTECAGAGAAPPKPADAAAPPKPVPTN